MLVVWYSPFINKGVLDGTTTYGATTETGHTSTIPPFQKRSMYILLGVHGKGVGRNFSRGGLSGAPGEGSPAIFQFPGGAQPRFLGASMVKMKEFSGQGGHGLPCLCLPTSLVLGRV